MSIWQLNLEILQITFFLNEDKMGKGNKNYICLKEKCKANTNNGCLLQNFVPLPPLYGYSGLWYNVEFM